jgi:hypothetical protein
LKKIKNSITLNSFLFHCDATKPIYLASDASITSHAAILYQTVSYDSNDIEALEQVKHHKMPISSIPTQHPVIPLSTKGVPIKLCLQQPDQQDKEMMNTEIAAKSDQSRLIPKGFESILPKAIEKKPSQYLKKKEIKSIRRDMKKEFKQFKQLEELLHDDGKVHIIKPVGFYSTLFKGPSKGYSVLEKEATGLVKAISHFSDLLHGHPKVYVITDSQALIWLLGLRDRGCSKIERLSMKLLNFPFKIIVSHLAGHLLAADFFTRAWVSTDESTISLSQAKRATVIYSPFKFGDIVTPTEIIAEIKKGTPMINIPNRHETAIKENILPIETENTLPQGTILPIKQLQVHRLQKTLIQDLENELTHDKIVVAQKQDNWCIRRASEIKEGRPTKYIMERGLLQRKIPPSTYSQVSNTQETNLAVIPFSLQGVVFAYSHINNHAGFRPIRLFLRRYYFIPGLNRNLRQFLQGCELCQTHKPSTLRVTPLGVTPLPPGKNKVWSLDLILGLESYGGNNALLSMVELFSGFRLAIPVKKTVTAQEVANIIQQHIIMHYGVPSKLTSDGGPNLLVSKFLTKFCQRYGIERHVGVVYSPKSHGGIEASNRYVQDLCRILADQLQEPFLKNVEFAIYYLNSKLDPARGGLSPSEIMFGSNIESKMLFNLESFESPRESKEKIRKIEKIISKTLAEQRAQLIAKHKKPKVTYEKGSFVMEKDFRLLPKKKCKARYFPAPLLVIQNYIATLIVKDSFGRIRSVHKDNLKPFPSRTHDLYNALPNSTKRILGFPYTHEQVTNAIENNEDLSFLADITTRNIEPDGPVTRSRNADANEEQPIANDIQDVPMLIDEIYNSDDNESDDDDDNENVNDIGNNTVQTPARVTFNIQSENESN